ncbi:MAG: hypothetical protein COA78_36190 [Blastopirellula sp.]|nr:MAG: hypothetical protein COA78_36190 [Blastopirellula sp.]
MKKRINVPEFITKAMDFPASSVRDVMSSPDGKQEVRHDDVLLKFYVKHKGTCSDIVILQQEPKELVTFACRVFHDLLEQPATEMNPVDIFKAFLERFGMTFRVGTFEGKLLFHEQVPLAPNNNSTRIIDDLDNPNKDSFVQSIMIRRTKTHIDAALAFIVNKTEYKDYVDSH